MASLELMLLIDVEIGILFESRWLRTDWIIRRGYCFEMFFGAFRFQRQGDHSD